MIKDMYCFILSKALGDQLVNPSSASTFKTEARSLAWGQDTAFFSLKISLTQPIYEVMLYSIDNVQRLHYERKFLCYRCTNWLLYLG
jgi:hypothetical protein